MQRQALPDGRWFDINQASRFEEATEWDGRNRISKATGSQWDHEELYLTANGHWILHRWSQWQGVPDTWSEIEPEEAVRWLIRNGHEVPEGYEELVRELEV